MNPAWRLENVKRYSLTIRVRKTFVVGVDGGKLAALARLAMVQEPPHRHKSKIRSR